MSEFAEVRRMHIRPGDIFVLEVDHPMSALEAQMTKERWQRVAGDAPLLIIQGRLATYRPVDSEGGSDEPPHRADRP